MGKGKWPGGDNADRAIRWAKTAGGDVLTADIAESLRKHTEMMTAHYAYQDEMARQQTLLLTEIRDAVTR